MNGFVFAFMVVLEGGGGVRLGLGMFVVEISTMGVGI